MKKESAGIFPALSFSIDYPIYQAAAAPRPQTLWRFHPCLTGIYNTSCRSTVCTPAVD
jgi:hypothetical protein